MLIGTTSPEINEELTATSIPIEEYLRRKVKIKRTNPSALGETSPIIPAAAAATSSAVVAVRINHGGSSQLQEG